ncbi:MAG: hypothetical protein M1823_000450 [Watsoniomyces obsoletus]|nr:MAG: hypothetical protein M1823_000450 [Watsoniomyces obsoletus]
MTASTTPATAVSRRNSPSLSRSSAKDSKTTDGLVPCPGLKVDELQEKDRAPENAQPDREGPKDHVPDDEKTNEAGSTLSSQPAAAAHGRHPGSKPAVYHSSSGQIDAAPASTDRDSAEIWECKWDGDDDPKNPFAMSTARKWTVVAIISAGSLCVTCASSVYTATYDQLTREFECSRLVATLGLSLFVMGLGIGPMLLAPLSEFYGRRPIYIISFASFIVWIVPSAVAPNIQTMLVARFFDGLSGSAFLSVAGGTVGDMFPKSELQLPMMVYTASPFVGPELGPLLGGFINQFAHWRWTFYLLLIWASVQLAAIVLGVPETYHPVLLCRRAQQLRRDTGDDRWRAPMERSQRSMAQTIRWSVVRPFQLLTLEPMCLNLCLLSALLLGVIYLFFGAFQVIFVNNHGFQLYQVGLSFMGLLVGMLLGMATDPWWHRNYLRLVEARELAGGEPGGSEPEYRLPPAVAGAVLVPIGLFWFGWTTFPAIPWIVPIIGSGLFGMGTLLIYAGVFTFLVDAYPLYAASALAANSFARSSFSAAFPLFGVQMYSKLGYQWATTVLAFLTLLMMPFPYIFYRYGKRIRGRSHFAQA